MIDTKTLSDTDKRELRDIALARKFRSQKEDEGWTDKDFVDYYSSMEDSIAYARAAVSAFYTDDNELCKELIGKAYLMAEDEVERLYILSLSDFINVRSEHSKELAKISLEGQINNYVRHLDTIRFNHAKHPLKLETEIRLLQTLVNVHMKLGQQQEMIFRASELVQVAKLTNLPEMVQQAESVFAWALYDTGQYNSAIKNFKNTSSTSDVFELSMSAASLGNYKLACELLEASEGIDSTKHRMSQEYYSSLFGLSTFEIEKTEGAFSLFPAWHSINLLNLSISVPPSPKAAKERDRLYDLVIRSSLEESRLRPNLSTNQALLMWARIKARMSRGEYGLALQELLTLMSALKLSEEDLFTQLLINGAMLELSVYSKNYRYEPAVKTIDSIREIFKRAQELEFASVDGLTTALWHWHPLSAAICINLQNPVLSPTENSGFLTTVNRQGRAQINGRSIPPWYVAQETLSYFGLKTKERSWNGNEKPQMKALYYGASAQPFIRPVITGCHVIYGLLQVDESYIDQCRLVYNTYGLIPASASEQVAAANEFNTLYHLLLDKKIDFTEFEYKIHRLHLEYQ